MKGKGPRHERETVFVFNEEDSIASIWTTSEVMYRRLKKMGYEPSEDNDRSASFKVPKKRVSIRRPVVLSEKRKAALEKMTQSRLNRVEKVSEQAVLAQETT